MLLRQYECPGVLGQCKSVMDSKAVYISALQRKIPVTHALVTSGHLLY